jgi:hypothetical protein
MVASILPVHDISRRRRRRLSANTNVSWRLSDPHGMAYTPNRASHRTADPISQITCLSFLAIVIHHQDTAVHVLEIFSLSLDKLPLSGRRVLFTCLDPPSKSGQHSVVHIVIVMCNLQRRLSHTSKA